MSTCNQTLTTDRIPLKLCHFEGQKRFFGHVEAAVCMYLRIGTFWIQFQDLYNCFTFDHKYSGQVNMNMKKHNTVYCTVIVWLNTVSSSVEI